MARKKQTMLERRIESCEHKDHTVSSLDITTLENWLWDAACAIRGPVDAAKFKDYILPLVFLKRLSDVFDDEMAHLQAELGADALRLVEQDHELVRFYLPQVARWEAIRTHAAVDQYYARSFPCQVLPPLTQTVRRPRSYER